jgi:hypothetical protein
VALRLLYLIFLRLVGLLELRRRSSASPSVPGRLRWQGRLLWGGDIHSWWRRTHLPRRRHRFRHRSNQYRLRMCQTMRVAATVASPPSSQTPIRVRCSATSLAQPPAYSWGAGRIKARCQRRANVHPAATAESGPL